MFVCVSGPARHLGQPAIVVWVAGEPWPVCLASIDHAHRSADLIETTPRRGELSFGST